MKNDTNQQQVPETIPPLPGGGSWRWQGGKWVSNDPVAEEQPAVAVAVVQVVSSPTFKE